MHAEDVLVLYLNVEPFHFAVRRIIAGGNLKVDLIALLFPCHSLLLPQKKEFFIQSAEVPLIACCIAANNDSSVIFKDLG